EMVDPKGTIAKLQGQVATYQAALKQRWEPAQMLEYWQAALQGGRNRKDLSTNALVDVKRVQDDPKATPEQKAKALAVQGLALRNAEQFAEAKAALAKALPGLPAGHWKTDTQAALKETSDPSAGANEKAELLAAQGKTAEALVLMKRAIDAPGGKKGELQAQRGLIGLEGAQARGGGKVGPDDEWIKAATTDADAAVKDNVAEGHYLKGRLAEAMGKLDEAEKAYRDAVKANPAMDAAGLRYR